VKNRVCFNINIFQDTSKQGAYAKRLTAEANLCRYGDVLDVA
jgi:hypothetical protein